MIFCKRTSEIGKSEIFQKMEFREEKTFLKKSENAGLPDVTFVHLN